MYGHGWDRKKVLKRLILVFQDEHPLAGVPIWSPSKSRFIQAVGDESGLPPTPDVLRRRSEPTLSADIVAKVGKEKLGSKNAQQSNRNEWIFESALRIGV
jgi:hypothetical protein